MSAKRGRLYRATGGAGPEVGVCVSQLMRVSTDRLHHQHPTLTAVEGSIPRCYRPAAPPPNNIRDPAERHRRRCLVTTLFIEGCHLANPPSCKTVSSPLMMDRRDATIGKSKPLSPMSMALVHFDVGVLLRSARGRASCSLSRA